MIPLVLINLKSLCDWVLWFLTIGLSYEGRKIGMHFLGTGEEYTFTRGYTGGIKFNEAIRFKYLINSQ